MAASPGASFPFPYNWSKFPTAWFAANATNWEDETQLDEIGKYSMAILGWQHLDTETDWTAVVYTQLTQAAIIKSRHPDIPVFVYCGYGFAFGLNAGTFPVMQSVMKDPVCVSVSRRLVYRCGDYNTDPGVRNSCTARTATFSCSRRTAQFLLIRTASRGTRPLGPQTTGVSGTFGIWLTHLSATILSRISSGRWPRHP